jgi:hypothetical protein
MGDIPLIGTVLQKTSYNQKIFRQFFHHVPVMGQAIAPDPCRIFLTAPMLGMDY